MLGRQQISRVRRISSSDDDDERSRRRLEKATCWKVGSNQIGTEERDRVDIDKQARVT